LSSELTAAKTGFVLVYGIPPTKGMNDFMILLRNKGAWAIVDVKNYFQAKLEYILEQLIKYFSAEVSLAIHDYYFWGMF
jgi:hypothetical protein